MQLMWAFVCFWQLMNTETEKFIFNGFMPIQITGKIEVHPNPKKNPVEKVDGEF